MNKILISIGLLVSLVGCSTATKSEDLNFPLSSIFKLIQENIPSKLAHRSENGRELYFEPYLLPLVYRSTLEYPRRVPPPERVRAKAVVLGDSRPYTVEVEFTLEKRVALKNNEGVYAPAFRLDKYEADFLKQLYENLVKHSKKQNLIDDFRPF